MLTAAAPLSTRNRPTGAPECPPSSTIRALQPVEVLAVLRLDGRQIICDVEDSELANLVRRRLLSPPGPAEIESVEMSDFATCDRT